MPRGRKTQRPRAVTDVYGEGVDSVNAQRQIPLPDNTGVPPPPEGPPPEGTGPQIPPEAKMQAALAAAAEMSVNASDTLAAPTNMPDQPITSGLPVGAGAGPEALHQTQKQNKGSVSAFFAIASDVFGQDPRMAQLASRAQQRGI